MRRQGTSPLRGFRLISCQTFSAPCCWIFFPPDQTSSFFIALYSFPITRYNIIQSYLAPPTGLKYFHSDYLFLCPLHLQNTDNVIFVILLVFLFFPKVAEFFLLMLKKRKFSHFSMFALVGHRSFEQKE